MQTTERLDRAAASDTHNMDAMSKRHQSRRTAMAGNKSIINELELALDGVRTITKHMQEDDDITEVKCNLFYCCKST